MLSLALALGSTVRRQRREFAVLKALGLSPRQAGTAVVWQALGTVVVGLAVGVPVGVVLGRELWTLFADQLNVVVRPEVPLLVTVAIIAAGT